MSDKRRVEFTFANEFLKKILKKLKIFVAILSR